MILLTGFAPFLGQNINPSYELAKSLSADLKMNGTQAESIELPVEYGGAFAVLKSFIETKGRFPDRLIMLGQAKGRSHICLERVALNWIESQYLDESGKSSEPRYISAHGPSAYIQNEWKFELNELPPQIKISHSAGTYVCNELYYQTLNYFSEHKAKAIFVHVPILPEQGSSGEAVMPMELQFQSLKLFTGLFIR